MTKLMINNKTDALKIDVKSSSATSASISLRPRYLRLRLPMSRWRAHERPLVSRYSLRLSSRNFLQKRDCSQSSCGRRAGLMVSALVSGSSGPGSSPGRGHCVVFLGKTLNSHCAPLHPLLYDKSLHLVRKYARIFVLSENCSLLGTDNVQGHIYEHIFAPNGGYCVYHP